jgi:prepilin-type N-terminal cleavage/methylation domain-containing protein
MKYKKESGFTLIEVLIVITILIVFFVAAMSVAVVNLKNLDSSRNKILGTRYAEELLEWLRGEKETSWEDFIKDKDGIWCFNSEPPNWNRHRACAEQEKINGFFTREANLTPGSNTVSVDIKVSWYEGANKIEVPLLTHFEEIK